MNSEKYRIIVDAGHGGNDPGAVGNNLQEKDLTLKASKYIYNRLKELGIPAVITREDDIYLPKSERIKKVLSLYDGNPNTILVSNHINAGGAEGAEVVYSLKNNSTLADLVLKYIGEAGQIKRKTYQRRLPENPNKDYYYILRESGVPEPILIEYGFIDNINDANRLRNNIEKYAEGVVKALAEYTNYPYTPTGIDSSTYTVRRGDTLYSISRKFNIPVEEIKRLNALTSNNISIGQVLVLKEIENNYPQANRYIVKRGDTLYSIALNNNTTVAAIKKVNNLNSDKLEINQILIIPDSNTDEINSNENYQTYIVKRGDSLWQIAKNFNIQLPELINLNNLTNLTLQIGDQLLVPKSDVILDEFYTVEPGDTLWSIAKNNDITVGELKELNNLTNNLLSVGQKLKIK